MIDTLPDTQTQLLECSADLRGLDARRELIESVLAGTQPVGERAFGGFDPVARTRARTLLSLLTYCYAADVFASEDIEWACANDAGARYICAGATFPREAVRRFRQANRAGIEAALTQVTGAADVARRKLNLAVMMDTAFCE
jgi:hypothetical protein